MNDTTSVANTISIMKIGITLKSFARAQIKSVYFHMTYAYSRRTELQINNRRMTYTNTVYYRHKFVLQKYSQTYRPARNIIRDDNIIKSFLDVDNITTDIN